MHAEQIRKAGAIILHNDGSRRIALIFRGKEEDWSFPKGHVEPDEKPFATCVREVKEEVGLDVEIITQLPDNEYLHKSGKKIITYMYLVRSKGGNFFIEKFEDKIEWVNIKDVKDRLSYENLRKYYSDILPIIESKF